MSIGHETSKVAEQTFEYLGRTYGAVELLGKTRVAIRQAAADNGWELVNADARSVIGAFDEFRKTYPSGRTKTYIAVSYSVRGAVIGASTPTRYIQGAGKAERIIAMLNTGTAR